MATVSGERGPLSPIRFIMTRCRYRQAKGAHTPICTHRHTLFDVCTYTHTQIKLLVCMLAHIYACAYKDTHTRTNYLFC